MGCRRPQSSEKRPRPATRRKRVVSNPVNIVKFIFTIAVVPDLFRSKLACESRQARTGKLLESQAGRINIGGFPPAIGKRLGSTGPGQVRRSEKSYRRISPALPAARQKSAALAGDALEFGAETAPWGEAAST